MRPQIDRLEVANPPSSFTQEEMLDVLGLTGNEFAEKIFDRCGVKTRHFARGVTNGLLRMNLQERAHKTEDQLLRLATRAVDELEIDPADIGTVITSNYYSLGGPTLAHRLLSHYEMDPSTDKYHVLGVGCASAVPLFKLAGQALRDHPDKHALVVAADSITGFLTPVAEEDERAKIVGSSLFGDGCAAALLTAGSSNGAPAVAGTRVHQVGETLDAVAFQLRADDSYMFIGQELPVIAEEQLAGLVDSFLADHTLERADIDHWLIHPGGRGIIEGVQRGLSLQDEDVSISTGVLADFGNMGTPSSFYVLKRTVEQRTPAREDTGLMVTIGPGVTVGLMLLSW
jgi:predicted naringenin-chalcone synthase